jgi:hypothetical protein
MIMRILVILLARLLLPAFMAVSPGIAVDLPRPGEALQGVVTITGSSDVPGMVSMEVSFAYHDDPTQTWFLIAESKQPVTSGTLATWDTTTITDGDYDLRLLIFLKDGTHQQVVVSGLRVRNYTPVETSTPQPVPSGTAQVVITDTPLPPTVTPIPLTPTPFPPNPAQLSQVDYLSGLTLGGIMVLVLFAGIGLYRAAKKWIRRRSH